MMHCDTVIEHWEMIEPFEISREVITHQPVMILRLQDASGHRGWSEAAGIDYEGETPQSMVAQIAALQDRLHDGLSHDEVAEMLPAGGARNALDCALWDLRAKQTGVPVWQAAGLPPWQPVTTAFTLGLGDEATTRRKARQARAYPLLKLKVDAQRHLDVVQMVRQEHPSARIVVDANQSWTVDLLRQLLPSLAAAGVELVEQPLPKGQDAELAGLSSPLPLAADESCTDRASLAQLLGRYQYINIKLDKCGGLTEGLALADEAARLGLGLMVGNMCGSSLAMAPAFVLAQRCAYVDLDGPLLQKKDSTPPMRYSHGVIQAPEPALWG
ncbi:N-acetyl-D-Glu racemase DgcA [Rhodoferax fermentans]|nr:N-acetyl-D-Glu racemase DgcA [Rhodoferax fermentans]MBK1685281.1 dipeptide epimerase [Rhodoferax fermentans]